MSAPHQDKLLLELGADVRTFGDVQAIVLWYAAQRIRREGHSASLDVGVRQSQEARDRTEATYLRIARCLAVAHPADDADEPLSFTDAREADRRLELLVAFYASTGERFTNRLQDLGYGGRKQCERYVLYAERVLRRRFKAEGLL